MPTDSEPTFWQKFATEVWAWFTSTRMQLLIGGGLLLYARDRIGIDEQTANYIRQAVVAAVIGVSIRDILQPEVPRVQG